MRLKIAAFHLLRAVGVFSLAQWLTRKRLRILCYHGFALGDEYTTAPYMFMRGSVFEERLKILKRRGLPVISLDNAIKKFQAGEISNAETVITLDDGWASNLIVGLPLLKKYDYPACIYITTEHLNASTEVFNVALAYMILKTRPQSLTLKDVHPQIDGTYAASPDPVAAIMALIRAAEKITPLTERQKLLQPLAKALGMDLDKVLNDDRFRLLTRQEIIELDRNGIDIQLHTHTHRLPDSDFQSMSVEILENQRALKEILGRDQNHFCYPSGFYTQDQPEWLAKIGIISGTTCDPGLNPRGTPVLMLKRFLDNDNASNIEFEAEVAGVRELARGLRNKLVGSNAKPHLQPLAQ